MKKIYSTILVLLFPFLILAQNYYFPPLIGDEWQTMSPTEANFCTEKLDSLNSFLIEKNTKAFIILKDGKIVVEEYFDNFTQDSVWYWASAGKTVTGFLIGVAQEENLLNINDKTSDYLGVGWTNAPAEKEELITIKHQLAMSTGLDDGVADQNCLDPSCLNYLTDAGDRWSYYNGPYRLLQDVIEEVSGVSLNAYTFQKLQSKTGMGGAWVDRVFFSKPRHMARFGSLIINQGMWNNTQVLGDQNFMSDMANTSNNFNQSYGYLWWLNGKGSFMLPQGQFVFNSDLIPSAPADMYSALGKNDQKLYIVPSQNIVVVRMGNDTGNGLLALSSFDTELWEIISEVICETNATNNLDVEKIKVFPNPVNELLFFEKNEEQYSLKIFNMLGQIVKNELVISNQVDVSNLSNGTYFIHFFNKKENTISVQKFSKIGN